MVDRRGRTDSSLALQIHGGAGYIEETGIAQRLRDSRIAAIYEGIGIRAIDLASRKVRRDGGAAMHPLCEDLAADVQSIDGIEAGEDTMEILRHAIGNPSGND